jgi:PPOX class probable F420-dependent enzyme
MRPAVKNRVPRVYRACTAASPALRRARSPRPTLLAVAPWPHTNNPHVFVNPKTVHGAAANSQNFVHDRIHRAGCAAAAEHLLSDELEPPAQYMHRSSIYLPWNPPPAPGHTHQNAVSSQYLESARTRERHRSTTCHQPEVFVPDNKRHSGPFASAYDAGLLPRVRPTLKGMEELSGEVIAFLSEGTRTGKLGYVASDGRPLVAPVWFMVDGEQLVFNTSKHTAKGRALSRDPRVVLCVDDPHPPYSFVQVQGTVSMSEDPDELLDTATRIGGRYMGADRAEEYGRRNGAPGEVVVRITPTKVVKGFNIAG